MAWLSDLAGKAENMLTKLDQNAANILVVNSQRDDVNSNSPERAKPAPEEPFSNQGTPLDTAVVSAIESELAENSKGMSSQDELSAVKLILAETKSERDGLKAEVGNLLQQIHGRATGKLRLADLEKELSQLREANRELTDHLYRSEKSISDLQISGGQLKQNLNEVQEQLTFAKTEADRAMGELQSYRSRAQSTLQIKERIIEELRTAQGQQSGFSDDSTVDRLRDLEIEQMKNEQKDCLAELTAAKLQMEGFQEHINKLENRLATVGEENAQNLIKLTGELANTEKERKTLHQEVTLLNAELQAVRTQSQKSNESLVQQLHEKNQEITALRKRSNTFQETGGNLDGRIKSLTQSLIMKQTSLEEMTADRNALRFQIEKLEARYQNLVQQNQSRNSTAVASSSSRDHVIQGMATYDDAQLPLFIQENPFDNRLAKRMKRVIRASDSIGAQLGRFLRRYPLLRLLFLLYTVLLHVWVMVVLMSSTPN